MKYLFLLLFWAGLCGSCQLTKPVAQSTGNTVQEADPIITQSLFSDRSATIPEEQINRMLQGNYKLPSQLRVALVKMDAEPQTKRMRTYADEDYLKLQQSYQDVLIEKLRLTSRVSRISGIPDLLVTRGSSYTNIREAAVRMQADLVVIYSITSDIYTKYKAPAEPDIKAFATTQIVMMDVKSGMQPFSTVVTKDHVAKRKPETPEDPAALARAENEAVLTSLFEVGTQITDFLKAKS